MYKIGLDGKLIETDEGMDEEIDEECAFNEEEEERFAPYFSSQADQQSDSENDMLDDLEQGMSLSDIFMKNIEKSKEETTFVEKNTVPESRHLSLSASSQKISLSDMLDSLGDAETTEITGEIKRMKKSEKLALPMGALAARKGQEELAYKQQKKDLNQWNAQVYKNRTKDHLTFKLEETKEDRTLSAFTEKMRTGSGSLFADLENLISQYEDKNAEKELESDLNMEDMKKRHDKLAKMRHLLSYEELKAKRIKKIKSKAYRKRQRAKKNKFQVSIEELEAVDKEAADEMREKARKKQAQERFDLRHKGTSKWAQRQRKRNFVDKVTRKSLKESHKMHQQLKAKMKSMNDEEESGDEGEVDLENLEAELTAPEQKTGIMSMGFMKKAAEKRKEDALRALEDAFLDEVSSGSEDESDGQKSKKRRRKLEFEPNSLQLKPERFATELSASVGKSSISFEVPEFEDGPTTFAEGFSDAKDPKKGGLSEAGTEEGAEQRKGTVEVQPGEEAAEEKEPEERLLPARGPAEKRKREEKANPWLQAQAPRKKAKTASDVIFDPTKTLEIQAEGSSFSLGGSERQKALIERAFALGGEELEQFEQEKEKEVEKAMPKAKNDVKFGWGSWAGPGLSKPKPSRAQQLRNERARAEALGKRRDKNLKHVIINDTRGKTGQKYTLSKAPFPFENKDQYNSTMAAPMGSEWTTEQSFRKRIRPEIESDLGMIINPLTRPEKEVEV